MLWVAIGLAALFFIFLGGFALWRNRVVPQAPSFQVLPGRFNNGAKERLCGSGRELELRTVDGMTYRFPLPTHAPADPPNSGGGATAGGSHRSSSAQRAGPSNVEYSVLAATPEIVVGAAATYDVVHNTLLLDDTVLRAMTQLSGEQVTNLADFRQVMAEHHYQLESVKFQGTVAEQMSADHFQEAGATVAWPQGGTTEYGASNNPGWDYDVSGVDVNSKAWADAGDAARAHFATPDNVDIPIVVPADSAHIPADALHLDPTSTFDASTLLGDHVTVVDHALTLSGIDAVTANADAVDLDPSIDMDDVGNDMIPGLGIAIVAVRSSISQGRLVRDGKTDAGRAAKNVAVDAAFRGGGAFAGAKTGAALGLGIDALFGGLTLGIPTAIGAIGGAIGGGMIGGKVATNIKLAPLREAQESLRSEIGTLGWTADRCSAEAQLRYADVESSHRQRFLAEADVIRRRYSETLWNLGAHMRTAAVLTPEQVHTLVGGAWKAVDATALAYTAQLSSLRGLDALIARRRRRALTNAVVRWRSHARQVTSTLPAVRIPTVFDVVLAAPGGDRVAEAYVDHVLVQRDWVKKQAVSADRQLVATLTDLRYCAVQSLRHESEELLDECEREIRPQIVRVHTAEERVTRELSAAGMS